MNPRPHIYSVPVESFRIISTWKFLASKPPLFFTEILIFPDISSPCEAVEGPLKLTVKSAGKAVAWLKERLTLNTATKKAILPTRIKILKKAFSVFIFHPPL
jgi:hypothetical protein